MKYLILAAAMLVGLLQNAARADALDACKEHLPFGQPSVNGVAHVTPICHAGYAALVDDDVLVPRWAAYHLTAAHTLGCNKRQNNFHADDGLPAARRARPADYAKSGYDIGHQAPAADFAWNASEMSDSFSLANMAPQLPGLNRQGWERLEEMVRTWAWTRGDLEIYVGPVLSAGAKTIGNDGVAVPVAFWKVVIDEKTGEVMAFEMPQRAVAKADALGFTSSIAKIESETGIALPLPIGVDRNAKTAPWPGDLSAWSAAAAKACDR